MNERRIHQIFEIGIVLKGTHALIECIGAAILYLVGTSTIYAFVNAITQDELLEDPSDFVATHLLSLAQHFSVGSKQFYAFYLASHGIFKFYW